MSECVSEMLQMEHYHHPEGSIAQCTSSASVHHSGPRRVTFSSSAAESCSFAMSRPPASHSSSSKGRSAVMCEAILEDASLQEQRSADYGCYSPVLRTSWGPFAAASYQQQQQQLQERSRHLLEQEQEQQLRQAQLEELLNAGPAGMSGMQLGWQQLEQLAGNALAGNMTLAGNMDRAFSNGTSTTDGMQLSNATELMFSVDCSFYGDCGAGAGITGFELNNSSCLESMPSSASDADWSAAVAASSSPIAGYDMCHWETASAAAAVNMPKGHFSQQQQFNRSNSSFRNNSYSTPIAPLQQLQFAHQHSLPLGSPTRCGNCSLSPKQFAAAVASINSARSLPGSCTNGSCRMSSQASCPLPRPPLSPVLQQQLQQQQQLLAQIQQQQYVQHQQLQQQQQQQQALWVLDDELMQLQQLAAKIDAAKVAAAPGSAAAAACDAAAVKHTAAVKRALAARANLQMQMAAATEQLAPASAAIPSQQQQQQHELHSVQSVPQLSPQHRRHAASRSATLAAIPYHRSATAAAADKPAGADVAAAAAAAFHRSASGPLTSAAQGKLAQLVKVKKMQAALQDELLQLLPMA